MNRSAFSFRRSGVAAFTLLELLVVIAIVAIVAGLLLPVLTGIRQRTDGTVCTSNLRQIGMALGNYLADNGNALPGPLSSNQLPTYSSSDPTSLAGNLAQYLALPPATNIVQKAPIFICPAYARVVPALNYPVYGLETVFESRSPAGVTQPAVPVYPFGVTDGGTQPPMRLVALTGIADSSGKPISLAEVIVLRDYTVHTDHLNALYFDWHVGRVKLGTMLPM